MNNYEQSMSFTGAGSIFNNIYGYIPDELKQEIYIFGNDEKIPNELLELINAQNEEVELVKNDFFNIHKNVSDASLVEVYSKKRVS